MLNSGRRGSTDAPNVDESYHGLWGGKEDKTGRLPLTATTNCILRGRVTMRTRATLQFPAKKIIITRTLEGWPSLIRSAGLSFRQSS